MGKKRIAILDESGKITTKKKRKEERQKTRIAGLKGGERVVDMGMPEKVESRKWKVESGKTEAKQRGDAEKAETPKEETSLPSPSKSPKTPKSPKVRSKAYQASRTKVDPTKLYSIEEAVKLVKQVSVSRFDGSVDVHISTHKVGLTGEVKFPHFKGKTKKVVIADEKVLEKIKEGKIDFDILLATKEFMPKLIPYAKILGPKGLVPNPKAGTIVDDSQKASKKFQTDSILYKTEKDQPLIHLKIGQVSQPEKELAENLQALITAVGPKNIKKLTIAPTMGPGIKIQI